MPAAAFYDALAPLYDVMTNFTDRVEREKEMLARCVKDFAIARALDAGAGTGVHSLALSALGVGVVAVDLSPEMIRGLLDHAAAMHIHVEAFAGDFHSREVLTRAPFDAVFCLGNTLPHIPRGEALHRTLRRFHDVLSPSAVLLVQLLNFEVLGSPVASLVPPKVTSEGVIERRHIREGDSMKFVITVTRPDGSIRSQSTVLTPYISTDLLPALEAAGFPSVSLFGNLAREPFDPKRSKDLVILAKRD